MNDACPQLQTELEEWETFWLESPKYGTPKCSRQEVYLWVIQKQGEHVLFLDTLQDITKTPPRDVLIGHSI